MSHFSKTRRAAGFRRVNAATRWLAAGAIALVGVFGFAAARETGAKSSDTRPPQPTGAGTSATSPPVAPQGDLGSEPDSGGAQDPGYQNDPGYQSGSDSAADPGFQTPDTLPQRSY